MDECHVLIEDGSCDLCAPLPHIVNTIIDEIVDEYDQLHIERVIVGRGLGLEKAEGTPRKYRGQC